MKNLYSFILTTIVFFISGGITQAQWIQQSSPLQSDDFYSIRMVSKNVGYAGSSRKILKTINGGLSWEKLHYRAKSPSDSSFMDFMLKQSIYFINEQEGFIGGKGILGSNDIIIKTTDGGQHWEIVYQGISTNFIFIKGIKQLFFLDNQTGYGIGSNSSFIKTVDGGKTWTRQAILNSNVNMINLQFFDDYTAIATAVNGLYKTTDKGVTWQAFKKTDFKNEISSSYFFNDLVGIVTIESSGEIYKTIDGGETWVKRLHPEAYSLNHIYFTSNTTGYIVGRNTILKTTTSGDYWEQSAALPLKNVNSCFFLDPNIGWAVGDDGLIIKTLNAGGPSKPYIDFEKPVSSFCEGINYTFKNQSDPNYKFTWLINNRVVSNSYDLITTFSPGTKYVLKLAAFNGTSTDTARLSFETPVSLVWEKPVTLNPLPDSICFGYRPQIIIPNSVNGAKYELYIDNVLYNQTKWGNGSDVAFFPDDIHKTTTFKVVGIKMNSCTSIVSEFSSTVNILPIPNRNLKNVNKSFIVCSRKDTFFVKIAHSEKTVQYQVGGNPNFYQGNGDTLLIPTTAHNNYTPNVDYFYAVRAKPVTSRDCEPVILNYLLSVKLTDLQVSFTVSSNNITVDTPLNITNNSNADSYEWVIRDGDSLIKYTGATVEPLKFATPGEKTIKLIGRKTYGCLDSVIVKVNAIPEAPSKILSTCWLNNSSLNHDNKEERSILDSYVDANGFIYITGYYTGQSRLNFDMYLAKYSPEGTLLWNRETDIATKSGSGVKGTFGTGIAVDEEGNIYLTGSYGTSELKFDEVIIKPQENSNAANGFLFKFNSSGIAQWAIQDAAKHSGFGFNLTSFTDVIINNNQEIYAIFYSGTNDAVISFTDKKISLNANGAILLKINKQGELVKFKPFNEEKYDNNLHVYYNPSTSSVSPKALAGVSPRLEIDDTHRLIIHGTFINQNSTSGKDFKIGSTVLTSLGENQKFTGFIGIYDPKLASGWSGAFKTFNSQYEDLTSNPNRNIIFKNNFLYVAGPNFVNTSFLSKYDLKGNLIWNHYFTYTQIKDIAISKTSDDLLLFGVLGSVPSFPSQEGLNRGTPVTQMTHFLASYNTNGNLNWLNSEPIDFSPSFATRVATNTSLRTGNCDDLYVFTETGNGLNLRKSSLGQSCSSSKLSLSSYSVVVCEGQSTQLTASGSTTGYSWSPVTGLSNPTLPNPVANPTKTTTYTVSALDENGCQVNRSITVVVEKALLPPAAFTFTATPQTTNIDFQRPQHLSGATLKWDFGDGTFSNEANPIHEYQTPGTYNVCLKAENKCNSVSICQEVTTNCEMASADFTYQITGKTIRCSELTTLPVSTFWNVVNGSSNNHGEFTFANPGIYQVCLTVSTPCGTKKLCKDIAIACSPNSADFTFNKNNKTINFQATTTINPTSEYLWDFGDGNTSSTAINTKSHTYATPGTYQVCLTTKNSCGQTKICKEVIVTCDVPSAEINYTLTDKTISLQPKNFASNTSYKWSFGDGTTNLQTNPVYTYSKPGVYNICLTATNICGETRICKDVTIICDDPSTAFTYTLSNKTISLQPEIVNPNTTYKWDFGNGSSGTMINQTYTYADGGTYNVCLTTKNGCNEVTTCKIVTILTVTGIKDDILAQGSIIFPNPASDYLNINFNGINLPKSVSIFNSIGGLVYQLENSKIEVKNKINLNAFASGVYIIQLQSDKGIVTQKVTINK